MDNKLTLAVKELAYRLGADLVGIANIERFENAPIKMSPKGILPCAKSVIVCAVHHPDAAIELDGEIHPQVMGPYRIQYIMNDKLDVLSFKIARIRNIIVTVESFAVLSSKYPDDLVGGEQIVFSFFTLAVSVLRAVKAAFG